MFPSFEYLANWSSNATTPVHVVFVLVLNVPDILIALCWRVWFSIFEFFFGKYFWLPGSWSALAFPRNYFLIVKQLARFSMVIYIWTHIVGQYVQYVHLYSTTGCTFPVLGHNAISFQLVGKCNELYTIKLICITATTARIIPAQYELDHYITSQQIQTKLIFYCPLS